MSKRNRPFSKPVSKQKLSDMKVAPQAPRPVTQGNVFATFLAEAQSIGNEVMARRAIERDVAEYLASKGLTDEFNAWLKAKQQTGGPKTEPATPPPVG